MREILFRGKRIDNGEWVYGYLYITHSGEYEIGSYDKKLNIERLTSVVVPESVGQYTGLKDKNGKKIFEGDIVKTGDEKYTGIIKYGKFKPTLFYDLIERVFERPKSDVTGLFGEMDDGAQCLMSDNCKVIGNIYDNPEY